MVNQIIWQIYDTLDMRNMRKVFLRQLSQLINFSFSDFSIGFINHDGGPKLVDPVVVSKYSKEFEKEFIFSYESKFCKLDYLEWVFLTPESLVYRESDLISDEVRIKSLFYQEYLKVFNLTQVAGIVLANNDHFFGAATFYRSEQSRDFDERDMYILELFVPHLQKRFENESKTNRELSRSSSYILKYMYRLTGREIPIMGLLLYGYSNKEIGLRLGITINTVKKHVSNIYSKLDINNRPQLIRFIIVKGFVHLWEQP